MFIVRPHRLNVKATFSRLSFLSLAQTGMDFNAKRMKGVFKKYLQFEMEHGDEAGVNAVKAKATEYVASLAG